MTPRVQSQPGPVADFRGMYMRHHGLVWHVLHRLGVPRRQVDDALQDVFVTAYRRRDDFDGRSVPAWLYGIARRVASNHRRAERRVDKRIAAVRDVAPSSHSATMGRAYDAMLTLDRYLGSLDEEDRELFILSEIEGMTGPEIADARGENLNTTYSRIRRLKAAFSELDRDHLERIRRSRPKASRASWRALAVLLFRPPPAATGWTASLTVANLVSAGVGIGVGAILLVGVDRVLPPEHPPAVVATAVPTAPPSIEATPSAAVAEAAIPTTPAVVQPAPSRPRAKKVSPPPVDELAEENALLNRAIVAKRAGDPHEVIDATARHAERFPESALEDVRTALRIEASCELGRHEQARRETAAFLVEKPKSPMAERIRRACPTSSAQNPDNPDKPGS